MRLELSPRVSTFPAIHNLEKFLSDRNAESKNQKAVSAELVWKLKATVPIALLFSILVEQRNVLCRWFYREHERKLQLWFKTSVLINVNFQNKDPISDSEEATSLLEIKRCFKAAANISLSLRQN